MKKIKEWINEKKKEAKKFCEEHKNEFIAAGYIVTYIGLAVGGLILCEKANKKLKERSDKLFEDFYDEWEEKSKENWIEERDREKWNKVNEFADDLGLLPNEEYWICGPDTYTKGKKLEIAHMVNGWGCYPPEEDRDVYDEIPPIGD